MVYIDNEKTKSLSLSSNVRSNLLVSQWVMSGLVHQHQLESLCSVIEYQFNSFTTRMLRPLLEDIGDIQVVMDLQVKALQSQDREDLIQHLERIEDIANQV